MPEREHFDPEPEQRDIDRLSQAWNAYLRGDDLEDDATDPANTEVFKRLDRLARPPEPARAFVRQLKEQLMFASISAAADGTFHGAPSVSVDSALRDDAKHRRGARWWRDRESWRGLGAVATVALVVVSLIATYLAMSSPKSGDPAPTSTAGMLAGPTPGTSPVQCRECDYNTDLRWAVTDLGRAIMIKSNLSDADLAAKNAQLQHWIVDPGKTVELSDQTPGIHGSITDVVLQGVYTVAVDAPAVVTRGRHTIKDNVEYLPADATVELERGDTISFPAGHKRTIVNPLAQTPLQFKSIVLYDGDVALTKPADQPSDGLQFRIDGNGVLPTPLGQIQSNEFVVNLNYIQIVPGADVPEERSQQHRIIGPVDPLQGPSSQPMEGYFVWVGPTLG